MRCPPQQRARRAWALAETQPFGRDTALWSRHNPLVETQPFGQTNDPFEAPPEWGLHHRLCAGSAIALVKDGVPLKTRTRLYISAGVGRDPLSHRAQTSSVVTQPHLRCGDTTSELGHRNSAGKDCRVVTSAGPTMNDRYRFSIESPKNPGRTLGSPDSSSSMMLLDTRPKP
jgi:hypothetical protein